MPRWAVGAAVFVLSFLFFAFNETHPIGTGVLDRVGKIEAQDEAVYSHIAIHMAEGGGWLTPVFLDRFFLYKPPLLYWLSGASARAFGVQRRTLRLPAALASAAVCALLFLWISSSTGVWSGVFAVLLLLASPLLRDLAARNLTDAPLTFFFVLALWLVWRDPAMDRTATVIGAGAAIGCAILTKSTAGLVPLAIIGLFWLFDRRAPFWRLIAMGSVAVAIAAPWFVYQYSNNQRWFWGEFVEVELLAYGATAPPQTSSESAAGFYLWRLARLAPAPLAAAVLGLVSAVARRTASRQKLALPCVWVGLMAAAIGGYQYHNATYLLPVLPALAILSMAGGRPANWQIVLLVPALLAGLMTESTTELDPGAQVARQLEADCREGRSNELIVVGTVDQFHATLFSGRKVRYAFEGSGQLPKGFSLDFRSMGIVLPVNEFLDLEKYRAHYRAELRSWGLPDDRALATVIAFPGMDDLRRLIDARPDADFILPAEYGERLWPRPHSSSPIFRPGTSQTPKAPPRSCML